MRKAWMLVVAGIASLAAGSSAGTVQEGSPRDLDRWVNREVEREQNRRGLWYGTPDVRAGDDMLGPIIDLIEDPSGLLDFKPRRLPPPPTDEFNDDMDRER